MGFFGKKAQAVTPDEWVRVARKLDDAEARYLEVLRREIANLIVIIDPDLMTRCYDKAWKFEREIVENPARAHAEEAALVAKFSMFSEFDLLNTRHFIPYGVARDTSSDDELVERYDEISRMLVFMRRRDDIKSKHPAMTKGSGRSFGIECRPRKIADRERIEGAITRFHAYRAGLEKGDPSTLGRSNFEDAEVEVIHLPSLPDNEYGIAFKKTGEFGVYGFHVFDSGEILCSYYRSDASFKKRKSLAR